MIAAILALFPVAKIAVAAELRHAILPADTSESLQTRRACYAGVLVGVGQLCSPSAFLVSRGGRIQLSINILANETAYRIIERVDSGDIDEEFLDRLFREQSFQTASGVAALQTVYDGIAVTYTPAYFAGAIRITNPSLPELAVGAVREARVTIGYHYLKKLASSGLLFLGIEAYAFKRDFLSSEFSALDLSSQSLKQLVERRSVTGGDGSFSVGIGSSKEFVPSLYLRLENAVNPEICDEVCKAAKISLEHEYFTKLRPTLTSYVNHFYGSSAFALTAPLRIGSEDPDALYRLTFSYLYSLARLQSFFTFSSWFQGFGFIFDAGLYRLGIQYSDEKQDNTIQVNRQKSTYVFANFTL